MAVTIDPVIQGIGGNPPTHIRVSGTVSGCETLHVISSCTNSTVLVPLPTGGSTTWSVDLPNNRGCRCGDMVQITAFCGLGTPSEAKISASLSINCGSCPQVTGAMSPPGSCDHNNTRPVTLTLSFNPPLPTGATASVTWIPGGSLAPVTTTPAAAGVSQIFNYPAGTYSPLAVVAVTLAGGQVCSTTTVTFGALQVSACLGCPTLAVQTSLAGCAPTNASASFTATLSWPAGTSNPPTPSAFLWTVDGPGGGRKAQRSGPAATVNTGAGWSGTLATPTGAVDLSQPGSYTVSVHATIPGMDPSCDPAGSALLAVSPCQCPAPLSNPGQEWGVTGITAPFGPNRFQTIDCGRATAGMTLTVDPGAYLPGDLRYQWDFGDGSPVVSGQGSAAAGQTHTFTNPNPGQDTTYTVTVTVSVAGSSCPPFTRTAYITVPGCSGTVCPSVSQLTPDRTSACINPGGSAVFNFTAAVTNPGAAAGGFRWDFGDGATQMTQSPAATHTYQSTGTFTVQVSVNGPAGSNCPPSAQTTTISVTPCGSEGGGRMSTGCWVLLIAALVLAVVASILGIVAGCTANAPLGIAAGIVGAVALLLLILWLAFCARENCAIFNWARWIVLWVLMIAPIVAILVGIIGTPVCGLITAGILWGYWGVVLAILDIAGPKIGCPLLPPPFP